MHCRGHQTGNQTLPGRNLPTHIKRGKNPHHPCENPRSFLPGNTTKMGNGGEAKVTWSTNQKGRMFNHRSTGWETIMNAPIPKLIKKLSDRGFCTEGRRTHSEIRMGLPGCRTDSEPVQQRESRQTELLSLRRQLGTTEQSPIHPRILTCQRRLRESIKSPCPRSSNALERDSPSSSREKEAKKTEWSASTSIGIGSKDGMHSKLGSTQTSTSSKPRCVGEHAQS